MLAFEGLYDLTEQAQVRFVGFHTEHARYDFAIVYTHRFFGKPLVVDMINGRSVLMGTHDIDHVEWVMEVFQIRNEEEADRLCKFFHEVLPSLSVESQY